VKNNENLDQPSEIKRDAIETHIDDSGAIEVGVNETNETLTEHNEDIASPVVEQKIEDKPKEKTIDKDKVNELARKRAELLKKQKIAQKKAENTPSSEDLINIPKRRNPVVDNQDDEYK
jgi:hypothetical protein